MIETINELKLENSNNKISKFSYKINNTIKIVVILIIVFFMYIINKLVIKRIEYFFKQF